jgi:hypothetical protein
MLHASVLMSQIVSLLLTGLLSQQYVFFFQPAIQVSLALWSKCVPCSMALCAGLVRWQELLLELNTGILFLLCRPGTDNVCDGFTSALLSSQSATIASYVHLTVPESVA